MKITRFCLCASLWAAIPLSAVAQQSATQPASIFNQEQKTQAAPPARGELFDHIHEVLNELNLSTDQKAKIDDILDQAHENFLNTLRPKLQSASPQERIQQIGQFLHGVRDQISAVLDDQQRAEWTKKLEELRPAFRPGGRPTAASATTSKSPQASPDASSHRSRDSYVEHLRDALYQLDLTQDQQARIKDLLRSMGQKFQALQEQNDGDSKAMRGKGRALLEEMQGQLRDILTARQREKLHDLMQQDGTMRHMAGRGDGDDKTSDRSDEKMSGKDAMQMKSGADSSVDGASHDVDTNASLKTTGPQVGSPAPEFSLKRIDGNVTELSKMKGRIIVIEFGSYSSPEFRERVSSMEKLKNDLGMRAQFFVIYTREAHAAGDWDVDRNKDAGIVVEQPRTADARRTLATNARNALKITVPILLDTIGNDTAIAYGASPNTALVIGRDGTILARQQWFDAYGLRGSIEKAIATPPVAHDK